MNPKHDFRYRTWYRFCGDYFFKWMPSQ